MRFSKTVESTSSSKKGSLDALCAMKRDAPYVLMLRVRVKAFATPAKIPRKGNRGGRLLFCTTPDTKDGLHGRCGVQDNRVGKGVGRVNREAQYGVGRGTRGIWAGTCRSHGVTAACAFLFECGNGVVVRKGAELRLSLSVRLDGCTTRVSR